LEKSDFFLRAAKFLKVKLKNRLKPVCGQILVFVLKELENLHF
jgi:hypothetical protein